MKKIAVIGGGPAGLRAAEIASASGLSVTLFDAKASVGRKFLVAGRGGLNLTKAESRERFVTRYSGPEQPAGIWSSLIADFDSETLRDWAEGLGVETFAASTGRVYPKELKAAPLLRRWVQRLKGAGVEFAMHHRWTGLCADGTFEVEFDASGERRTYRADAVVLALGGGSWPDTGSDGRWVSTLQKLGIETSPLAPANCGWEFPWPESVLTQAEGKPLKNIVARAGQAEAVGELLVTRYGLEGGALYQLGSALRAMESPTLSIDLKPSVTAEQLVAKMSGVRRDALGEACRRWRLGEAGGALLAARFPADANPPVEELARAAKDYMLHLTAPRPIAEAISSAGGVRWRELDEFLMLKRLPGVFAAGEMIDWEAPTGGYLIQGCFATGTRAARGAVQWLSGAPS